MFSRILTAVFFVAVLVGVIAYARGYRLDINNTELSSNGLVAITSSPRSAKVYINNSFKGITDLNLYLEPQTYTITVTKEGYFPWSKTLKVQGEIVQSVDATLYPVNASLSPLTNIGVAKAIPFGVNAKKVMIFSENMVTSGSQTSTPFPSPEEADVTTKKGVYVYDTRNQAVSIFPSLIPVLNYTTLGITEVDPTKFEAIFSPNYDQAILIYNPLFVNGADSPAISQLDPTYVLPETFDAAYLIGLGELNTSTLDVTNSVKSLVEAWTQQKRTNVLAMLTGYEKNVQQFLIDNTKLIDISVDKTRIMYEATASANLQPLLKHPLIGSNQTQESRSVQPSSIYVYDTKEDKNYLVLSASDLYDERAYPMFHPNSRNIILDEKDSIDVADYDGLNKQKVYSGPYEGSFIVATTDGRVVILSNLNPALNKYPDLYAVGIK